MKRKDCDEMQEGNRRKKNPNKKEKKRKKLTKRNIKEQHTE